MARVKNNRRNTCLSLLLAVVLFAWLFGCSGEVKSQNVGSDKQRDSQNSGLVAAVENGNLAEARRLLEQGADPILLMSPGTPWPNSSGLTRFR